MAQAGVDPAQVVGIGTDFTACTILPTLSDGTPLCLIPQWSDRPHAYPKLWKHHAAQAQADQINALAHERGEPWIGRYGGKISAEWAVRQGAAAARRGPGGLPARRPLIEAADWIIWQLCGTETRNACTAGYKGIYQDGRYPTATTSPRCSPGSPTSSTSSTIRSPPLGGRAGGLTATAAAWTGLPEGIAVAVGNVDAHVTAAAAQALAPGRLVAIMGTSTCHVMNGDRLAEVPGMCGVVDGGISAGAWGYEAGQSGVGDIFGWYVEHGAPAGYASHEELAAAAARQPVGAHGLVALDWWNGNRSLLVNHELSGLLVGLTLATRPPDIYRALLESTAFGTRMIIEAFETAGLPVADLVVAGGLAGERAADADLRRRHRPAAAPRRLGPGAGARLGHSRRRGGRLLPRRGHRGRGDGPDPRCDAFRPDPQRARAYDELYAEYRTLHDHFGRGGNDVMLRLRAVRNAASADGDADDRASRCGRCGETVAALHAELTRYELVVWTAGNVSARVPGADLMVIKPSGVSYEDLTADSMVVCDLDGVVGRGRPEAVQRHRGARLRLPRDARGRRGRAHAQPVRHRLGRPRRADPVRAHRAGGRVRRRDPGRAVRADRRRRHRPRHRRHAVGGTARPPC